MSWTLTPDQFALAWGRTDGDRIPYPLAVRLSARDTDERAAQLPGLNHWLDRTLDADLEAALRVLACPELRVEVFGQRDLALDSGTVSVLGDSPPPDALVDKGTRPVRILGAAAGDVAVVAAQRVGSAADRGGDIRVFVGSPKSLSARVVSLLPENTPGDAPQLSAPRARVGEDSRDLVTVPVAGPTLPARIRRLLRQPRDGIGQIVVSARRGIGEPSPFGVLCWIDVVDDGRYVVRTGADVCIAPVDAQGFTDQLRPMVRAAGRAVTCAERG